MKKRYYAVYGSHSLAVLSSWETVQRLAEHFRGIAYKKFSTFEEAKEYALAGFLKRVYTSSKGIKEKYQEQLVEEDHIIYIIHK